MRFERVTIGFTDDFVDEYYEFEYHDEDEIFINNLTNDLEKLGYTIEKVEREL